jgi:hypothetical protein
MRADRAHRSTLQTTMLGQLRELPEVHEATQRVLEQMSADLTEQPAARMRATRSRWRSIATSSSSTMFRSWLIDALCRQPTAVDRQ